MGITKGSTWKGIFAHPLKTYPQKGIKPTHMILEILTVDGNSFSGITIYPESKIKLKIKGVVKDKDTEVYFVEYEILEGKALIPNIYKGHLIEDSISGISIHRDMQATFYVELQK